MDLENLGGVALTGGGSALTVSGIVCGLAKGWISGVAENAAAEVIKPLEKSIDNIQDQIERIQDTMEEHGMICKKLESADGQTQINLLKHFQDMAEKSADFRDDLRHEFVTKDALDGRILRMISEHCRDCPRRDRK